MSWSITVEVKDGVATVTGQTTGESAPLDGHYYMGGHTDNANESISMSSPYGGCNASKNYLTTTPGTTNVNHGSYFPIQEDVPAPATADTSTEGE